jgi:hypothetical protein
MNNVHNCDCCNRNEYQKIFLEVKGDLLVRLTIAASSATPIGLHNLVQGLRYLFILVYHRHKDIGILNIIHSTPRLLLN